MMPGSSTPLLPPKSTVAMVLSQRMLYVYPGSPDHPSEEVGSPAIFSHRCPARSRGKCEECTDNRVSCNLSGVRCGFGQSAAQ